MVLYIYYSDLSLNKGEDNVILKHSALGRSILLMKLFDITFLPVSVTLINYFFIILEINFKKESNLYL